MKKWEASEIDKLSSYDEEVSSALDELAWFRQVVELTGTQIVAFAELKETLDTLVKAIVRLVGCKNIKSVQAFVDQLIDRGADPTDLEDFEYELVFQSFLGKRSCFWGREQFYCFCDETEFNEG